MFSVYPNTPKLSTVLSVVFYLCFKQRCPAKGYGDRGEYVLHLLSPRKRKHTSFKFRGGGYAHKREHTAKKHRRKAKPQQAERGSTHRIYCFNIFFHNYALSLLRLLISPADSSVAFRWAFAVMLERSEASAKAQASLPQE